MSIPAPIGYGLYAQQGINLLQVAGLRIPCFMASLACVTRIAEIALRQVSEALKFFGFNSESTFAKWVTSGVDYVRPYKDAAKYPNSQLLMEAVALAAIGIIGNALVSTLFGPAPKIYNRVLEWFGPIRVSNDLHPAIQMVAQRFSV